MRKRKSSDGWLRVLRQFAQERKGRLDELKANAADLAREDLVWHYLLQSFSTWGSSRGWEGLIGNKSTYERVTYDALSKHSPSERLQVIEATLRDANVRYPAQKAGHLCDAFDRVSGLGGLAKARRTLLEAQGREGKLAFLRAFKGIGPKYARNIMMDVYHPEFRDSIAVDARIRRKVQAPRQEPAIRNQQVLGSSPSAGSV